MLAEASFEGHREMVQLLLDKGVSVNLLHPYFGSALQAASAGGHKDIVNVLLVKGAKVDAQGGKWRNALGAAAFHGKVSVARLLLEHGASINVHGGEHSIALAFSLVAGHFDIASLLLEKGARFCKIGGATFEVCETTASEQGKAAVGNEDANGGGKRHNNLILRHPDGHDIPLSKLSEEFAEFESRWGESSDE
jgi:ankyrin repeat protein